MGNANFPMSLTELSDDLETDGIELNVYRARVDYDQRAVGADVYITLECKATIIPKDDETPEEAYNRAMRMF